MKKKKMHGHFLHSSELKNTMYDGDSMPFCKGPIIFLNNTPLLYKYNGQGKVYENIW